MASKAVGNDNNASAEGKFSVQLETGEIVTMEKSQQELFKFKKALTKEFHGRLLLWSKEKGTKSDWPWEVKYVLGSGPKGDKLYGYIAPADKKNDKRGPRIEEWDVVKTGMAEYEKMEKDKAKEQANLGVGKRGKKSDDQSGSSGNKASEVVAPSSSNNSNKEANGPSEEEEEIMNVSEDEDEEEEEGNKGKQTKRKSIRTEEEVEHEEMEEEGDMGTNQMDLEDEEDDEAADPGDKGKKAIKKRKVEADGEAFRQAAKAAKGHVKNKGTAKKVHDPYTVMLWLRDHLGVPVQDGTNLVTLFGADQIADMINTDKVSKRSFSDFMKKNRFKKEKKGAIAEAAQLLFYKWCTPLSLMKQAAQWMAVGGGGSASSAGNDTGPSVVPTTDQDTGKEPVEYMQSKQKLYKHVADVCNFTPLYRMLFFVSPLSVPPKGKAGAPAEFMYFLSSVAGIEVLKPMDDGEERDFSNKFELMEAIALAQMSPARAKVVTKQSLKDHNPTTNRISDLLDKQRLAIRGSEEYKSIQGGLGQHYTNFWSNHDDHHHLRHLDKFSREIVGVEWNEHMKQPDKKTQVKEWAAELAKSPNLAADNPMFQRVKEQATAKVSDKLVKDFFAQELKQLKSWKVVTEADAGKYDGDGNLEENTEMAWPELIDYVIVKAAGRETDFNRQTTRPYKEGVKLLLATLCEETLWSLFRDVNAKQPKVGLSEWDWEKGVYPPIPDETHSTKGTIQRAAWNALSRWWAANSMTPDPLPLYVSKADVTERLKLCFPTVNEREIDDLYSPRSN